MIYEFVTGVDVLKATSLLDAQTSEVTIATLLFTPQPESYPDVATLLKVTFTHGQYGDFVGTPSLYSVTQTMPEWYRLCALAILSSVLYLSSSVYSACVVLRSGVAWYKVCTSRWTALSRLAMY